MGALAQAKSYKLSVGYRRTALAHKRAMGAPMIDLPMAFDPVLRPAKELGSQAHALRERQAVQYASAMARKTGVLPNDQTQFVGVWDEKRACVYFMLGGRPHAKFEIPSRVLEFNPDFSLLCLPEPEAEPKPCADTMSMFDDTGAADAIEEALDVFLDGINAMWKGN